MAAGTRERTIDARALAVSILVHAIVVALVVGAPSHPRATWAPASAALVDVALVEPSEPGGSTTPALSDALPSPVVTEAPAIVPRRALVPRSRERVPEAERIATPAAEASTAPSSIGDSTAHELGSGTGEGAGAGEGDPMVGAVSVTPEPPVRCGDPVNGVWNGRAWLPEFGSGGLWLEVRLTLHRHGEGAEGSAQLRELWPRGRRSPRARAAVTCAEYVGVFSVTTNVHARPMTEPGAAAGAWDVLTAYYGPEDVVSMCGMPSFRGARRRQIVMRVDGTDTAEGRAPTSFTLTRSACASS